MKAAEMV
jgi:hypothetical protein